MTSDKGKRDALRARVLSALVLGPVAILAVVLGGLWFDLMVAVAAVVVAWEWSTVCCGRRGGLGKVLMALVAVAPLLVDPFGAWALLAPALGLLVAFYRVDVDRRRPLWIAAGCLYIGVPAIGLAWIRLDAGWQTVLWLFLVVWTTDIAAYGFGRRIGGPRLWPRVSPNKTWAGLIGGVGSAAVVGVGAAWMMGADALVDIAGLALLLGIVSQGGDLFESAFKRRFRVKDSGDLIPGHGGLLDRADGLIAATPALAIAVLAAEGGIQTW
ncbi:phosphatidate cytidylyltransferase [Roseospira marina]|uniref:Phosphatidate cytidylyltransferase n=1 Tax=Roseospira marina TaxID=140057 RepID=A0A5M6I8K8_9PROT|nr:phosphatidate cytidylyltransferase [Roseospira marina]KAA5604482.1 phosphatidate cytidylyltransferase [Roseospira marina]MBB4315531.1 phosphatidate cytidylyltransferase [Roseospira marina]MBB5088532.1 phosphatidate cytidylyltransferase [Roseospira marina]